MAKSTINRLSDRRVRTAPPGKHADGGGLYLRVSKGVPGVHLCLEGRSPIVRARAFKGFKVWDG